MSRNAVAIVSSMLFVAFAAMLALVPVPYVAWRPGQTINVLATGDNGAIINISGVQTYDTSGSLLMTTVSTTRVDSSLSLLEAIFVYLRGDSDALPREVIYQPGLSTDQVQREAVAMMDASRSNATVAALRAAGVAVTEMPRIEGVVLSGPASGKLEPGDLIVSVDGIAVKAIEDIEPIIVRHAVGDDISFKVLRAGKEINATVTTTASNTDAKRAVVGISLGLGYRYAPVVNYGLDSSVTGPSAGLIFALGIYDRITDGQLLGGRTIAGTGTIDPNGNVGAIGGIREKIKGAERDGASVFLVPAATCANIGDLETNVTLVKVSTLKDAIAALQLLNEGNTAEVPTCG